MKVLLVNDSTSNPNWGDRAAAIALKRLILESGGKIVGVLTEEYLKRSLFYKKRVIKEKNTNGVIQKFANNLLPPVCTKLGKKIVSYLDSKKSMVESDLIPTKWEEFDRNYKQVLKEKNMFTALTRLMKNVDLMIIHGDGCMVGNTRIARALFFLTYIVKKEFNVEVIIVNHTADFEHPDLHRMAREIYALFDDVVYRDFISAEKCKGLCTGRTAADTAFLFKPMPVDNWALIACRWTYFDVWPDTARFDPETPYICIGGSSIFFYNQDIDYLNAYYKLVHHLQSIYSGQIVLTVSDLRDQEIFRPIAENLDLPLIGLSTPVQQSVDVLGNAQAYIGGRWHPGIFALRGGTPIIPISSITFKMEALSRMAGLANIAFDSLKLEQEIKKIGEQLLAYLEQGNVLRKKLRNWAEDQSKDCWENVAYLKTPKEKLKNNDTTDFRIE